LKKIDLSVQHFLYDVKTRYEAAIALPRVGEGALPAVGQDVGPAKPAEK
jgi:hypothetical protein